MSIQIPVEILSATTVDDLGRARDRATSWRQEDVSVASHELTDAALADLLEAAEQDGDRGVTRRLKAIREARLGVHAPIPSIAAAEEMILAFLREDAVCGWLWTSSRAVGDHTGPPVPWLVTDVTMRTVPRSSSRDEKPSITISLVANGIAERSFRNEGGRLGLVRSAIYLDPESVTHKTVPEVLTNAGAFWETAELRDLYKEETERYREVLTTGFAEQYVHDGPIRVDYRDAHHAGKVIHDISPSEIPAFTTHAETSILSGDDKKATGEVPVQPMLRVFSLATQSFLWAHISTLVEYEYDTTISDKLVLPESQRELLDILTTDIDVFVGDVVRGKSAGNVILCKGMPGVGKTLSAEVYAEITKRPLYSIHSGSLGTVADEVRARLVEVFARAQRWNAVLLLDEADVFILERRDNIQQNAIVAEFLRTLEYFTGLLFMTTNRPNDIDDAIISRCAAIISYTAPTGDDAARTWRVLAAVNGLELSDALVAELLAHFPTITPREMKMLLRLVLRVSKHRNVEVDLTIFRQAAIFRGLEYAEPAS